MDNTSKNEVNLGEYMERFFVTGSSGFVGTHLVQALIARGGTVAVYQRDTSQKIESHPTVQVFCGDIRDRETLTESIQAFSPDTIFHLAADNSKTTPLGECLSSINVIGVQNIVYALMTLQNQSSKNVRLVALGTLDEGVGAAVAPLDEDAHEIPISVYGLTKLMGTKCIEYAIRAHNLNAVVLRASIIYGPGQKGSMFIPSCVAALVSGKTFQMSSGEQKRDVVYVDDVIDALIRAHEKRDCTGVVNIASGEPIKISDIADRLHAVIGSGAIERGSVSIRPGEALEHRISIEKANRLLQWRPRISFEVGIQNTVDWYQSAIKRAT